MMAYVAPKFQQVAKRQLSIPFSGTVGAGLRATIVAGPITFKFRVIGVEMVFDYAANNQLYLYWFVSGNRDAPTTNPPPDTNIFAPFAPANYFTGMGLIMRKQCSYVSAEGDTYLKLHAWNQSAVTLTINTSIMIEEV